MKNVKLISLIIVLFLIIISFGFMILSVNRSNIKTENPIVNILLMESHQKVDFEGTIIRVGNYVWVERESWAIRILNSSNTSYGFSYLDFGDRVHIRGDVWKHQYGQVFLNVSNIEVLSKGVFPRPIKIDRPSKFPNLFVKIKNQKLLDYSDYIGKGEEFWLFQFDTYKALIPKSRINITLLKNRYYDLVGVVHYTGTLIWLTEFS